MRERKLFLVEWPDGVPRPEPVRVRAVDEKDARLLACSEWVQTVRVAAALSEPVAGDE